MHDEKSDSSREKIQVIAMLPPADVKAIGKLPKEAVAGFVTPDPNHLNQISPEQFRPNMPFVHFLHNIIKTYGPDDPALKSAAVQQNEGWLYIIDLRTPEGPQGNVPSEDIVGGFEVKVGKIVQDSYWANENHLIFSKNGLVRLPPFLHDALIRELKRL